MTTRACELRTHSGKLAAQSVKSSHVVPPSSEYWSPHPAVSLNCGGIHTSAVPNSLIRSVTRPSRSGSAVVSAVQDRGCIICMRLPIMYGIQSALTCRHTSGLSAGAVPGSATGCTYDDCVSCASGFHMGYAIWAASNGAAVLSEAIALARHSKGGQRAEYRVEDTSGDRGVLRADKGTRCGTDRPDDNLECRCPRPGRVLLDNWCRLSGGIDRVSVVNV